MRKFLFLLVLFLCIPLMAQDYIHRDYYGQGGSEQEAVQALLKQIGDAVPFDNPAILGTYQADIRKSAIEQRRNGMLQLGLSGTRLDQVFQARQDRAAGILDQGRKTEDPSLRKVYYNWGWYYLSSLPPGHQLPGKEELRKWLLENRDVRPARLPVPMTHIEREVATIRAIVGDWDKGPAQPAPVMPVTVPAAEPEEKLPVREQVTTVEANVLPQEVLDHSGTLALTVPIPDIQPSPVAPTPLQTALVLTGGLAPEPVLGVMLSVQKEWGGILAVHSNFTSARAGYEALSDGSRPDGGYIWPDGTVRTTHLSIAAGCSHCIAGGFSAFLTTGYAYRNVFWKDGDGQWARIRDLSDRGLTLSAGVLFHWNHLALSASVSTLSFQTLGVSLGIGYAWNVSLPR